MNIDRLFESVAEESKTKKKIKDMFRKTLQQIAKMMKLNEGKDLEQSKSKDVSLQDKRALLKKIYAKTLKNMGQESNIETFNALIDTVPESYLDYELNIDTEQAGEFVDDLIKGKGEISSNELGNIANIVSGVGIPAIKEFAAGNKKMSKADAEFGSKNVNKNVKEYLKSKKDRNDPTYQLAPPESKELIQMTKELANSENTTAVAIIKKLTGDLMKIKNSKFSKIASGLNAGERTDLSKRMPRVVILNKSYEQATKEDPLFLKMQPKEYYDLFNEIKNQAAKEKVKVEK